MPESPIAPDVRQLSAEELPSAQFPAQGSQDFRVYFASGCHAEILRHASEDVSVEICGVLVGHWKRDDDGPFVEISDCIRAESATSKFAEVTFTHESWAKINKVMDERFADARIVGWYHSHPDFGIFLSDRDVFIQENFFSAPGQVAHVVDPVRKTEGVFTWSNGKPTPCSYYWIGETLYAEPSAAPRDEPARRAAPAAQLTSQAGAPLRHNDAPGPLWNWTAMLLMFVLGCLVWQLLAQGRSNWERQMLFEGIVKHYGLWKGMRPGLKQELDSLDSGLAAVSNQVNALAQEHVKLAGEDGTAKRTQWREVLTVLRAARNHLDAVEEKYCLSDAETKVVEQLLKASADADALSESVPDASTDDKDDAKDAGDEDSKSSSSKSAE